MIVLAAVAVLGRTCGQTGLFEDVCKSFDMSRTPVVEMAPALLERGRERQMGSTASQNGSKIYSWEDAVSAEMDLQSLWERRWFCRICTTINQMATICSGSWAVASVCENRKIVGFEWRKATCDGDELRRVATNGECRRMVDPFQGHGLDKSLGVLGRGFAVATTGGGKRALTWQVPLSWPVFAWWFRMTLAQSVQVIFKGLDRLCREISQLCSGEVLSFSS